MCLGADLTADKEKREYYYNREIVQVRQEKIPKIAKGSKVKEANKVFCKETSVFRNWKPDT